MQAKLIFVVVASVVASVALVAANAYGPPTYNDNYEQAAPAYAPQSYNAPAPVYQAPSYQAPQYRAPSYAKHSQYDNYYPKYQAPSYAPAMSYAPARPMYAPKQMYGGHQQASQAYGGQQDSEYYAKA